MFAVQSKEFWEGRIKTAGTDLRQAVYITNDDDWDRIDKNHGRVLSTLKGRVLETACGYGRWSPLFTDYVGVDISPHFIELAKQKYPGKEFLCADIGKGLPFKDKEFDHAFCVSFKGMIIRECGVDAWVPIEAEIRRVAKSFTILEYSSSGEVETLT